MTSIVRADINEAELLSKLAKITFIESHGSSAKLEDINNYVKEKYNAATLREELKDLENIYHAIYHNSKLVGYSKIIFNSPYADSSMKNIAKLERLYLLKEVYNLKLGLSLFQFNYELAKSNNQLGIWLYVWKKNSRAISFYQKAGFQIIGNYNFKISETHSNPNYQLFLLF